MSLPPRFTRAALLALGLSACAAADPASADRQPSLPSASGAILVGNAALAGDDPGVAAESFRHALAAEPGNAELQRQAFTAALLAGRPEALTLARQLPTEPAALLLLADADIKKADWRAAEAKFAQLPSTGPNQVLRPLLLAWAEQGAGDTDEALATLRPFLEGTRYRGVFALHAAMICDLAGRSVDAARLYRLAAVEYGALNLRLGTLLASWQARSGNQAEARATIHAMTESSPELRIASSALQQDHRGAQASAQGGAQGGAQPGSAVDGVAETYLTLAASLQQQDAPDFGRILLQMAIDLRPDFTAARLLMAELLAGHGQVQEALAVLAPVPADDPLKPVAELRAARYNDRLGRTATAAQILHQVATDLPQRPEPLAALGEMQSAQGHFAEAAATFGSAISRLGEPVRADWSLYYEQGTAFDRAHDWPRAEADFLHALELAPDQPFVLNYLGYAWIEQGRNLPRARQMIERAVEQRPNDGSFVDSLGWVLLQGGDRAGAIQLLERAAELEPEDPTINAHLGDAYEAAGRHAEAHIQWRRALILNPDPQDAARLQAKLGTGGHPVLPATAERHVE